MTADQARSAITMVLRHIQGLPNQPPGGAPFPWAGIRDGILQRYNRYWSLENWPPTCLSRDRSFVPHRSNLTLSQMRDLLLAAPSMRWVGNFDILSAFN